MNAVPLLRIDGASKSFPGVQALSNVGFDLLPGEVHALVGENGAGKSTLMKVLAGIQAMDEGQILVDDEPVTIDDPQTARQLGISVIHQEFHLMPELTVAQNIYIGRERQGRRNLLLNERELNRRAAALFEQLGIEMNVKDEVGQLSVARQQLVEIAKALSFDARVLVMDEPTAALNDAEVQTLFELIERFRTPTSGVIYISHRMEELRGITDRITVLRDGQYIDTFTTADTSTATVISAMVGRTINNQARPGATKAGTDIVLEVRGLSTKPLLRDVSFDLRKGEILGFAGLMGAGRTELARALVGADPTDGGTVAVNGRTVKVRNPADAAELGLGYLSEDRKRYGLLLDQDVVSNVLLPSLSRYTGPGGFVRDRAGRETVRSAITSMRVKTPSLKQTARDLSGGNQQKLVIAKWLAKDCDILLFDEPTRGIDVGAKEEIYDLLTDLAGQGKSIIMISSELEEVLRMSDRIAVMCAGRVTAILDNKDADQEVIMQHATRFLT